MRFMILVKANADSEAGVMPTFEELAEMGRFNEELVKAGVLLAGEGLHPSAKGARVRLVKGAVRKLFVIVDNLRVHRAKVVTGIQAAVKALLKAIPEPDPNKMVPRDLPRGEIPDAAKPPLGCSFHPRCPEAFEPCGWQGADLVGGRRQRPPSVVPVFPCRHARPPARSPHPAGP